MKKKKGKGKKKKREYSLKSSGSGAPPGNRTRVARMGILHDTTTPAALLAVLLRSHCSIPTDTRCVRAVLQPWCCVSCLGVVRKPRRERCACRRPENRAAVSAGETEARPPEQRWLQGHGHAEARPHRSRGAGQTRSRLRGSPPALRLRHVRTSAHRPVRRSPRAGPPGAVWGALPPPGDRYAPFPNGRPRRIPRTVPPTRDGG